MRSFADLNGQVRMDRDHVRRGGDGRDRRPGFRVVVGQGVEPGIDGDGERHDQQRVAVLGCVGDQLGADHAAGAAAVLDHELLAQPVAQVVGDHAPDGVVDRARRERNDDANRLGRIVLREWRASSA